jgi:hypothetical protein
VNCPIDVRLRDDVIDVRLRDDVIARFADILGASAVG